MPTAWRWPNPARSSISSATWLWICATWRRRASRGQSGNEHAGKNPGRHSGRGARGGALRVGAAEQQLGKERAERAAGLLGEPRSTGADRSFKARGARQGQDGDLLGQREGGA